MELDSLFWGGEETLKDIKLKKGAEFEEPNLGWWSSRVDALQNKSLHEVQFLLLLQAEGDSSDF